MYQPNPNLVTVCMLPANPADLTLEQARAMCGGDVKAVLRDMVRECQALDAQLALRSPQPVAEPESVSA